MVDTWRHFFRTSEGRIGFSILIALLLGGFCSQAFYPHDPLAIAGPSFLRPFTDPHFPLGTDALGRDLAAQLVHGAKATFLTALSVMGVSLALGSIVGAIAGYFGGWIDELLTLITNAAQTVSPFLLALALVSVAGPTAGVIVAALSAGAWAGPARVIRAETQSLKTRAFVDASRLAGRSGFSIAFLVVLPNALTPLVPLSAIIVASALLAESALSYLGLGDPNHASWGAMAAAGRTVVLQAPHIIAAPSLAIIVTVLGVNLLGEGFSKALHPDSQAN